LTFDLNKCCST